MVNEIIKKLDEADAIIRRDLQEKKCMGLGEQMAYEKARELIQEATTKLLRYQF